MVTTDADIRNEGRVLIFVVAYQAERHLSDVFGRIPQELYDDPNVDFVCIDDASSDAGARRLAEWVLERKHARITVARNPVNQGYGGNQKLGYRLAIESGYDFVILLHGDGQYAPELLPRFIELRRKESADVVLGSRMAQPGEARRGGMPLYKRIGNRFLTRIQNGLTGLNLTEYHTGYRGYSTSFLRSVPFEANTNEFSFDTEILLQADYLGAKIVEFPIPTHYGDEVCHVPGWRYSWDVFAATVRYRLHRMGMLCSLLYRDVRPTRYMDKTAVPYSSHRMAIDAVESLEAERVLDLGCGIGTVASELTRQGREVTGVDVVTPIPGAFAAFYRLDLDRDDLPLDPFSFDAVLLLDVIEHLSEPERFLVGLRNMSRSIDGGQAGRYVVLSTPNVAFAAIRFNLLLGRFSYAERGILDVTHRRLFTRNTLLQMLADCGYVVDQVRPVPVPVESVAAGRLARFVARTSWLLARIWPSMFAFQFLVVCRPRPSVAEILEHAETTHQGEVGPRLGTGVTREAGAEG